MTIRTEKIEGVIHVYDDAQHVGTVLFRQGKYHTAKDVWPRSIPESSLSRALDHFRPHRPRFASIGSSLGWI